MRRGRSLFSSDAVCMLVGSSTIGGVRRPDDGEPGERSTRRLTDCNNKQRGAENGDGGPREATGAWHHPLIVLPAAQLPAWAGRHGNRLWHAYAPAGRAGSAGATRAFVLQVWGCTALAAAATLHLSTSPRADLPSRAAASDIVAGGSVIRCLAACGPTRCGQHLGAPPV
jgi:hypothetical protein